MQVLPVRCQCPERAVLQQMSAFTCCAAEEVGWTQLESGQWAQRLPIQRSATQTAKEGTLAAIQPAQEGTLKLSNCVYVYVFFLQNCGILWFGIIWFGFILCVDALSKPFQQIGYNAWTECWFKLSMCERLSNKYCCCSHSLSVPFFHSSFLKPVWRGYCCRPVSNLIRIGQTVAPERRLDFVRRTLIDSESTMTHWSTTIPTYLKADWFGQEVSGEWRRRSKDRIGIYNQSNHDLVKRFQVRASLGKDEKMVKGLDRIDNGWMIIALHIIKTRERTIKKDRRLQWKSDHLSPSLTFARDQDLLPPSFEASWDPVRLLWTLDIVQTDTVLPFPSFPPSFSLFRPCADKSLWWMGNAIWQVLGVGWLILTGETAKSDKSRMYPSFRSFFSIPIRTWWKSIWSYWVFWGFWDICILGEGFLLVKQSLHPADGFLLKVWSQLWRKQRLR